MKIITAVFLLLNFWGFGQKNDSINNPNSTVIVKNDLKKEILSDRSLYSSNKYKMTHFNYQYEGFIADSEGKMTALDIFYFTDSIVTQLFFNELLILDSIVSEYKKIYGFHDPVKDTIHNIKEYEQLKTIRLINLVDKGKPDYCKLRSKRVRTFEIWLTFNLDEDGWGSFYKYDLIVKKKRRNESFDTYELVSIKYIGIQI